MIRVDLKEALKSAGTYPTGPVSAWPKERNDELMAVHDKPKPKPVVHAKKVTATTGQMARGLLKNAAFAVTQGKVSKEIRDERYETCKNCPLFIEESKRCSDCGCFMEAKTWLKADKALLCPKDKWAR